MLQMDGILEGVKTRAAENDEILGDDDFDTEYSIKFLNYIADIWDYKNLLKENEEDKEDEGKARKAREKRPSCSVLIKVLPEIKEFFVGHNTWHEYSAMGYRSVKIRLT